MLNRPLSPRPAPADSSPSATNSPASAAPRTRSAWLRRGRQTRRQEGACRAGYHGNAESRRERFAGDNENAPSSPFKPKLGALENSAATARPHLPALLCAQPDVGTASPCHLSSRGAPCPCGTGRAVAGFSEEPRGEGGPPSQGPLGPERPLWGMRGRRGLVVPLGGKAPLPLLSHTQLLAPRSRALAPGQRLPPLWGLGLVGGGDSLPDPPGAPRFDEVSVASFGRQPWPRRWVARPCEHGDRKHSGRQQTVALATGGDSDTRARNREAGGSCPVWAPGPGFHGESPGGNGPGAGGTRGHPTHLLLLEACEVPAVIEPHLFPLPVLHEGGGCGQGGKPGGQGRGARDAGGRKCIFRFGTAWCVRATAGWAGNFACINPSAPRPP